MRAALVQAEQPEAEQRNLLAAAALIGSEKKSLRCSAAISRCTLMTSWKAPT